MTDPTPEDPDTSCIVRVCRDCCCGTVRKHPGVDHEDLFRRLALGVGGHARVLRSACLLACGESNVVVVTPSPIGRRRGGHSVWVAGVLDRARVGAVVGWVVGGGPGLVDPPAGLVPALFPPPALSSGLALVSRPGAVSRPGPGP